MRAQLGGERFLREIEGHPRDGPIVVLRDAFLQLGQFLLAIVLSPFIVAGVTLAGAELVSALVSPVLQILIVLIYFDLRVRREALDLFQMAYRLAAPAPAS